MRTSLALALATLATALTATAAPTTQVAFTTPLWDRPAELEQFAQSWPDAPAVAKPFEASADEPAPSLVAPEAPPPDENYLHAEPHSDEWNCLVPLNRAAPAAGSKCENPSLEPDKLLHLL